MKQPDLYAFLGVTRDAGIEQINQAFREKALTLHPDKNKGNPQATQDFKLLTQAYQILTDPVRRKKYDATLPPPVQEPVRVTDLHDLWKLAGKIYFDRTPRYTPAVDALRESVPLAIEDEKLLIVGLEPAKSHLIGYLGASETHNTVCRILAELYGKPLDFRIIAGTALQDWTSLKDAEERLRQRRMAESGRAPLPQINGGAAPTPSAAPMANGGAVTFESWDELMDGLMPQWSALEFRSMPQARARFVFEQIPTIARMEEKSRMAGMAEDLLQRNVSRALERVASLTNIESGAVGLEYQRFRMRLLGGF